MLGNGWWYFWCWFNGFMAIEALSVGDFGLAVVWAAGSALCLWTVEYDKRGGGS